MLVLSRFTTDGDYPTLAAKLAASCRRHGITYDIQPIEGPPAGASRQQWLQVMHQVPQWLLLALCQQRGPVAWLDVDCEIIELPVLLLNAQASGYDFAEYNWHADPQALNNVPYDPNRLLGSGGVILFGYTAPALELLVRWCHLTPAHAEKPCDQVLDVAYNSARVPVRPLWLPKSYNRMTSHFPEVAPVINHLYRDGGHKTPSGTSPGLVCNRCRRVLIYERSSSEPTPFGPQPICPECEKTRDEDAAAASTTALRI